MNIRGEKMISELLSCLKLKKIRREFKMNTNPPSYSPPHYTLQSGNRSCTILKDLSEIPEVTLFNICTNTYMYTHIYTYKLTCLIVMLIIWLSQGEFILADLAIKYENCVVAHGRAFNTCDDQIIYVGPIGFDI